MYRDSIVEEIHKYRLEHAAKFNYDLNAMVADYKRQEKESSGPFIRLSPKRVPKKRPSRRAQRTMKR